MKTLNFIKICSIPFNSKYTHKKRKEKERIDSPTTRAPAHLLARSMLGPPLHRCLSQSYLVTLLTVLEPVGDSGSTSSPPSK